eukprot:TRINITY_DN36446_c0_g1_i1.p2 TRINITY_DN36446_c0_g1~~TRINITY_DN36446_c0_g1_i1.p2  ORF type:complete len:158 (+),score=33.12 TRINITY_DN36446_c0_g1_i1:97-570(+)
MADSEEEDGNLERGTSGLPADEAAVENYLVAQVDRWKGAVGEIEDILDQCMRHDDTLAMLQDRCQEPTKTLRGAEALLQAELAGDAPSSPSSPTNAAGNEARSRPGRPGRLKKEGDGKGGGSRGDEPESPSTPVSPKSPGKRTGTTRLKPDLSASGG